MKCIPLIAFGASVVLAPFASAELLASYVTQGVSGNAAQWNGAGGFATTALPAVRGAGLGLAGGFNQFAATGVATTSSLSLANNDYVRFGFTLSPSAGAEYAVTEFRATCGSAGVGSTGMQYQVWAFLPDQAPFALHAPASMGPPASRVDILLGNLPGNAIVFPGQTAEFRVYFWGAAAAQNTIAFISDGNAQVPDTSISGIPVPGPGGLLAAAGMAGVGAIRRRRVRVVR
jgi:MYXO-CTERM domain-containing protein